MGPVGDVLDCMELVVHQKTHGFAKHWLFRVYYIYIYGIILASYVGIKINHYKEREPC